MNRTAIRISAAVLIFLMPVVSSLGSVVTVAGLAAARPWALLLCLACLGSMVRWNDTATLIVLLAGVWLGWGVASLHSADGFRKLFAIGVGFATALGFVVYPWTRERLRLLARAWLSAWLVAILPACYEIATGRHLPNYLASSPEWTRQRSDDIASYFVNPNPFAYFLCASMIVFAMGARLEGPRMRRVLIACCLVTPLIITQTASRAVLAVSLLVVVWVLSTTEWVRTHRRTVLAASAVAVAVAATVFLLTPGMTDRILSSFQGSGSDRVKLYLNSVWMFVSSWGLGVGPGMFEPIMRTGMVPHQTTGAVNPHSGVFEVLSQYGFLVSAAVGAALVVLAVKGSHGFRRTSTADPARRIILQGLTVTAVALPLLSFGDSTFLDSPIAWAQIATTLAFFHAQHHLKLAPPAPAATGVTDRRLRVLRRTDRGRCTPG